MRRLKYVPSREVTATEVQIFESTPSPPPPPPSPVIEELKDPETPPAIDPSEIGHYPEHPPPPPKVLVQKTPPQASPATERISHATAAKLMHRRGPNHRSLQFSNFSRTALLCAKNATRSTATRSSPSPLICGASSPATSPSSMAVRFTSAAQSTATSRWPTAAASISTATSAAIWSSWKGPRSSTAASSAATPSTKAADSSSTPP